MTTDSNAPGGVQVEIVYALPDGYWRHHVSLPDGAVVADALAEAAAALAAAEISVDPSCLAVFGKTVEPRTRLRDGDRIELLRPLLVNPRDARTRRASTSRKRQG